MKPNYTIIILDGSASSFCYYEPSGSKDEMSLETLKESISFCTKHNIYATIIYPAHELESSKQKLLDRFVHVRILPLSRASELTEGDVLVVNYNQNEELLKRIPENNYLNLILRLKIDQIRDLEMIYHTYHNRFCRLTIILTDIHEADEDTLNRYRLNLKKVRDYIYPDWGFDGEFQLNIITDRMILREMNNCNAGITHFTIAPNGKFYICPGFYIENPKHSIGSFTEDINIPNAHLLNIDNAPICSMCDCFHCKRCVYLNQKTTLEVNTPSHQQCVTAHHERNATGVLLNSLQKRGAFSDAEPIKPLFYLDPFELIKQ